MSVIQFPKQKPPPEDVVIISTRLANIARAISLSVHESTNAIMAAGTAEELSIAVNVMHDVLVTRAAGFAKLVEATRHWR